MKKINKIKKGEGKQPRKYQIPITRKTNVGFKPKKNPLNPHKKERERHTETYNKQTNKINKNTTNKITIIPRKLDKLKFKN